MNGEICAPIHSGPFCFLLTAQDRFLLLNRGRYVLTVGADGKLTHPAD